MKRLDLGGAITPHASLHSDLGQNVQEVTFSHPLTVAKAVTALQDARPRMLARRMARQTRRFAH